jgi:small subunit ribosomal protein S17
MTEDQQEKSTVATAEERNYRKTRQGYVVSDKMDKTVVVEVEDRVKHPSTARSSAAAPRSRPRRGQRRRRGRPVLIMETRPLSATKHWRLVEILERAK